MSIVERIKKLYRPNEAARSTSRETAKAQSMVAALGQPSSQRPEHFGLFRAQSASLESTPAFGVNVVAVHGLRGDRSFRSRSSPPGSHWLEGFGMNSSRLYTFEYPQDVYFSPSLNGLSDQAEKLLHELDRIDGHTSRPLVFVCHGLGGILVKKAICIARVRLSIISKRVRGILFLGTPHGASNLTGPGALFGNIVSSFYEGDDRTKRLMAIRHNISELSSIAEEFLNNIESTPTTSFYEAIPTAPVNEVIVDRTSSMLEKPNATQVLLQVDHRHICQIVGENPGHYDVVVAALRDAIANVHVSPESSTIRDPFAQPTNIFTSHNMGKVVNQGSVNISGDQIIYNSIAAIDLPRTRTSEPTSPSIRSFDESERIFLSTLSPMHVYGRQSSIDEKTEGTLVWLADNADYKSWVTSTSTCILLVSGHTGSGKSVLASHVARLLSEPCNSDSTICRYFVDGTVSVQSDVRTLLRSFIYQIILERPRLLKAVKRKLSENPQLMTELESLWNMFKTLATNRKVRSLTIIIDAIDECSKKEQEQLLEHLIKFVVSDSSPTVKILVTSRSASPAIAALKDCTAHLLHLALEHETASLTADVNSFISWHVRRLIRDNICHESYGNQLEKALQTKAESTFLWVALAISLLHQRRFLKRSEIDTISNILPADLTRMYNSLLESIPEQDRGLASKALQFIRVGARNLNFDELNTMLTIESTHSSVLDVRLAACIPDARSVESLLRGLVQLYGSSNDSFALIHHTLKEHFVDCSREDHFVAAGFQSRQTIDHYYIAETCMRYLSLPDFQTDIWSDFSPNTPGSLSSDLDSYLGAIFKEPAEISAELEISAATMMAERFELFDYAARYWAYHFSHGQLECSSELQELARELCAKDKFRAWLRYLVAVEHGIDEYPVDPDALTLACFFGHHQIVHRLVSEEAESKCPTALYWAARKGNTACIEALYSEMIPKDYWASYQGFSPLATAAANGHFSCVRLLLEKGYRPNECASKGRTPLYLAAAGAHCDVVSELLRNEDTDPNFPDSIGATPLFGAVAAGSSNTVSRLLTNKLTDASHVDKHGRNALSWACEYGLADIIDKLCLHIPKSRRNDRDMSGQTPLMYAVRSGDRDAVLMLLPRLHRSDVSALDSDGRNALSWAAQHSNLQILESLLKHYPGGANVKDKDGWSPLAWTLDPPEKVRNAVTLLRDSSTAFDDASGLEMFSLAVSWKAFRIAQELVLARKFAANTQNATGRTALSFAAEAGQLELVRHVLKLAGVDVHLADDKGRTPHFLAASAGYHDICKLIVLSVDKTR